MTLTLQGAYDNSSPKLINTTTDGMTFDSTSGTGPFTIQGNSINNFVVNTASTATEASVQSVDISPFVDITYDLGTSSAAWNTLYVNALEPNGGTNETSNILIQGSTDEDKWLRLRTGGGSPLGRAGLIFSRFNNPHYFITNDGNILQFYYSTQSSATPDIDDAASTHILNINGSGDIYPEVNGTSDLGTTALGYANVYASASGTFPTLTFRRKDDITSNTALGRIIWKAGDEDFEQEGAYIQVNGTAEGTSFLTISQMSFFVTGDGSSQNEALRMTDNDLISFKTIRPITTSTYNLGTSALAWNNIYGNKIIAANNVDINVAGYLDLRKNDADDDFVSDDSMIVFRMSNDFQFQCRSNDDLYLRAAASGQQFKIGAIDQGDDSEAALRVFVSTTPEDQLVQMNATVVGYRPTVTVSDDLLFLYSNVGATKRQKFHIRADGNITTEGHILHRSNSGNLPDNTAFDTYQYGGGNDWKNVRRGTSFSVESTNNQALHVAKSGSYGDTSSALVVQTNNTTTAQSVTVNGEFSVHGTLELSDYGDTNFDPDDTAQTFFFGGTSDWVFKNRTISSRTQSFSIENAFNGASQKVFAIGNTSYPGTPPFSVFIHGTAQASSDVYSVTLSPWSTNTYDLGQSSFAWNDLYVNTIKPPSGISDVEVDATLKAKATSVELLTVVGPFNGALTPFIIPFDTTDYVYRINPQASGNAYFFNLTQFSSMIVGHVYYFRNEGNRSPSFTNVPVNTTTSIALSGFLTGTHMTMIKWS
jgi:hypothetical protein